MTDKKKSLILLLSPTLRCNMQCEYCYVKQTKLGDMSINDFKSAYAWTVKYCRYFSIDQIRIMWFGGEPLACGVDLLSEALELQKEYFYPSEISCINSIQSNLTLVDSSICDLIKRYFHNHISGSLEPFGALRQYKNGNSAIDDIMTNIGLLKEAGIRIGIVCTLTKKNITAPELLYHFFKSNDLPFRVNRAHCPTGQNSSDYLTVSEYNKYVLSLFELYSKDDMPSVDFANFTSIVRCLLLNKTLSCIDHREPHLKLAIESNGKISSWCRQKESVLGNYYNSTSDDIVKAYAKYMQAINPPENCKKCDYFEKNCTGPCFGELDKSCQESSCGYRTEYTDECMHFVREYLNSHGVFRFDDCAKFYEREAVDF